MSPTDRRGSAREGGLADLAAVVADFEAEYGEITEEEMERAARAASSLAVSIGGPRVGERRARRRPSRPSRGRRR